MKLFCEKVDEGNLFFQGLHSFSPDFQPPTEIICILLPSTSYSPATTLKRHIQSTRGLLGLLLHTDAMVVFCPQWRSEEEMRKFGSFSFI